MAFAGLDIINPKLAGIKQFPIEDGRYIVLLFKTEQFSGELVSSEEGQMELTEFQYLVNGDNWTVSLK